jgi:hypothetical protein
VIAGLIAKGGWVAIAAFVILLLLIGLYGRKR